MNKVKEAISNLFYNFRNFKTLSTKEKVNVILLTLTVGFVVATWLWAFGYIALS